MQPTPNTQMADSASNNSTDSSLSLVRSLHPNPQNREHSNITHSGLCKLHTTNCVGCTNFEENKTTKSGTYYQCQVTLCEKYNPNLKVYKCSKKMDRKQNR
jgi:hypothetical protein